MVCAPSAAFLRARPYRLAGCSVRSRLPQELHGAAAAWLPGCRRSPPAHFVLSGSGGASGCLPRTLPASDWLTNLFDRIRLMQTKSVTAARLCFLSCSTTASFVHFCGQTRGRRTCEPGLAHKFLSDVLNAPEVRCFFPPRNPVANLQLTVGLMEI